MVFLRVRRGKERNRFGVGEGKDRLAGVRPEGGVEGVRRGETARVRLEKKIGGFEERGAGAVVVLLDLVDVVIVSLCE